MRTTLNIDDDLLQRAQAATGARTRTETIELGLKALLERDAARRLIALGGTGPEAWAPARRRPDEERR